MYNLSGGGEVSIALEKAFWGDYFGMLRDLLVIKGMLRYTYKPTPL